jgi:hypothetical protein
MSRPFLAVATILLACPASVLAQPAQSDDTYKMLAQTLKPILIKAIPATLHEKSENWDHQVMVPVGLKWSGIRPQISKSLRNHGEWKRLKITAHDLPRTLDLKIFDFKEIDAEKQTFKVFLTMEMGVEYEQQNWESGVRLWSGSVRARAQMKLDMDCENTLKVELDKNGLPEFILRIRVTNAKLHYDKLVFEHINGIGGDGAKLIGEAAHRVMKQWRPSIERDLLAKANAAIVKAADSRDIRVSFGSLLKPKERSTK